MRGGEEKELVVSPPTLLHYNVDSERCGEIHVNKQWPKTRMKSLKRRKSCRSKMTFKAAAVLIVCLRVTETLVAETDSPSLDNLTDAG